MNRTTQDPGEVLYCTTASALMERGALGRRAAISPASSQLPSVQAAKPARVRLSKLILKQKTRRNRDILLLAAMLLLGAPAPELSAGGSEPGTYLVPLRYFYPPPSDDPMLRDYQSLWEKKLFVTPGDLARFLVVGGLTGREYAVSVYRKPNAQEGDSYWFTVTAASSISLWEWLNDDQAKRIPVEKLEVDRCDMPLSSLTAEALHLAWLKILKGVRSDPNHYVGIDNKTVIFSASSRGKTLRGEILSSPKGDVLRLLNIAEDLAIVCLKPSKHPNRDLRKIEKRAREQAKGVGSAY